MRIDFTVLASVFNFLTMASVFAMIAQRKYLSGQLNSLTEKFLASEIALNARVKDLELAMTLVHQNLKVQKEERMQRAIEDATNNPEKYLVGTGIVEDK